MLPFWIKVKRWNWRFFDYGRASDTWGQDFWYIILWSVQIMGGRR
jgi:hypothetical protein